MSAEFPHHTRSIGYDLDDVLVDTGSTVMGWYNDQHGTSLTIDDWYDLDHDLSRWKVDTFKEAVDTINGYFTVRPEDVLPIPGAVEFVERRADEGWRQHIITGRPNIAKVALLSALELHFGSDRFNSVSFTNHFGDARHEGRSHTKAELCAIHDVDIFVEDLPAHALALTAEGIPTILFGDYHWNRAMTETPLLTRANTWEDVENVLERISHAS